MPPVPPEQAAACQAAPADRRGHVHVFFVNGLDPLYKDNFCGMRDYVARLGFEHTYLGQMVDYPRLEEDIRRIHHEDPRARFVLVGFSFGANLVKVMAHDLRADGIGIDLLAYLGGDTLQNTAEYRPENVRRIINVTSWGCIWLLGGVVFDGVDLDGARNLRLADAGHADLPTHPRTLALLAAGLAEVAADAR
jgi:hypothetical protein